MKIIDGKKLIGILVSGIILINLTGCSKTKEENIENKQSQNESSLTIEQNDSNTLNNNNNSKDNVIDKSFDDTVSDNDVVSETNNSTNIDDSNLTSDEIVLKYFNDAAEEINNMMNSENVNNVKSKCREYFIIFVDFIFYDGKIKGVTFSNLKDTTKMQVITITRKLDSLIMKKFPDYKEDISSSSKYLYDKASDILNSGKANLEDYVISKIGEEKYQDVLNNIDSIKENDKETLDKVKEYGSEKLESGKEKVKEWYQNFKNNE